MSSPYVDALKLLAGRDLSEARIRQRLARLGHDAAAIDDAVERLKAERALDDARTAAAIARSQVGLKGRGPRRVMRQIESAGIDSGQAKRAVDDVFADVDEEALLEAAIARRLRGRAQVMDDSELRRLYRHLVAQGFEHDRIMRALRSRKRR